ncbi:unnamed protein product [Paramecium sonneborni]|uniref:Uncharacterized protein n=1 Tax=Paramecium sonneborni TaxID=65129 RepID=A0A8S1QN12_9CILI|nr:unnamed protein product [Paramecium sonneborni]
MFEGSQKQREWRKLYLNGNENKSYEQGLKIILNSQPNCFQI